MPSSIASSFHSNPVAADLKPLPPRTLADVRDQVAQEIGVRIVNKAEIAYDVKIGVMMTFSKSDDIGFLKQIAQAIKDCCLPGQDFLFAIATTGPPVDSESNHVFICGSTEDYVTRAVLLTTSKFVGRVTEVRDGPDNNSIVSVKDIGYSSFDEAALQDIVRKSAFPPIDPLVPPPGSRSISMTLLDVRAKLQRLQPTEAYEELREPEGVSGAPTFLVDIRSAAERDKEGGISGSLVVDRNLLEWKLDPRSEKRLNVADRYDLRIIVFCQDGEASSLAAYSLQKLGLLNATDMIGGYNGWRDAGLPVDIPIRTTHSVLSLPGESFIE